MGIFHNAMDLKVLYEVQTKAAAKTFFHKNWIFFCFPFFTEFCSNFYWTDFSLIALKWVQKTYLLLSRTVRGHWTEINNVTGAGSVQSQNSWRPGVLNLSLQWAGGKNRSHGLQLIIIFLRIRSKSFISNNRTRHRTFRKTFFPSTRRNLWAFSMAEQQAGSGTSSETKEY